MFRTFLFMFVVLLIVQQLSLGQTTAPVAVDPVACLAKCEAAWSSPSRVTFQGHSEIKSTRVVAGSVQSSTREVLDFDYAENDERLMVKGSSKYFDSPTASMPASSRNLFSSIGHDIYVNCDTETDQKIRFATISRDLPRARALLLSTWSYQGPLFGFPQQNDGSNIFALLHKSPAVSCTIVSSDPTTYLLEGHTSAGEVQVWVDAGRSFNCAKYTVKNRPFEAGGKAGISNTTVDGILYERIEGNWIATRGHCTATFKTEENIVTTMEMEFSRKNIAFHPEGVDDALLRVALPDHTPIGDDDNPDDRTLPLEWLNGDAVVAVPTKAIADSNRAVDKYRSSPLASQGAAPSRYLWLPYTAALVLLIGLVWLAQILLRRTKP